MRRIAGLALLAAAVLAGCGSDPSAPPTDTLGGLDPNPPRAVADGVTIMRTETGEAVPVGRLMPPLEGYAAAKEECGFFRAGLNATLYGGKPDDFDSVAAAFASRRAAPGAVDEVRRGCRAGLHD